MMINRAKIAYFLPIIYLATLTSCSTAKEYISGIMEDDREGFVVYKRESIYDDTQFNLELPPDLINPSSPDSRHTNVGTFHQRTWGAREQPQEH